MASMTASRLIELAEKRHRMRLLHLQLGGSPDTFELIWDVEQRRLRALAQGEPNNAG